MHHARTGGRFYRRVPLKPWVHLSLVCAFVAVHVTHANMVYTRTYSSGHGANGSTLQARPVPWRRNLSGPMEAENVNR